MNTDTQHMEADVNYWLVGATWEGRDPKDQTARFLEEGVWINGYENRDALVKTMQPGDRIAIKTSRAQSKDLPFAYDDKTIGVMDIQARGTIVRNHGDGKTIEVEWDPDFTARSWYFYMYIGQVWKLSKKNIYAQKLIDFIFNGAEQDYEWFKQKWEEEGMHMPDIDDKNAPEAESIAPQLYTLADMISDGVFMELHELEAMLERLRAKKNVILQGAPGVGKTFIARKLAYGLMGQKDHTRVRMVQFHQSYSYEDFVRGYRPEAGAPGSFSLQDGVFHQFCKRAKDDPSRPYVCIIDEINRGNLSQIFGELLMLIEADKRSPEYAVPLVYRKGDDEEPFYIPPNVYILGLMNIADRSLAMVDYALRRRFAFITLPPRFGSSIYKKWLLDRGMDPDMARMIIDRMSSLNAAIARHQLLGPNYCVGHSYFCPGGEDFSERGVEWYRDVVETEIVPLLEEYFFDAPETVKDLQTRLLES